MINARNRQRWTGDSAASVQMYNVWFMDAAPAAYASARGQVVNEVERLFVDTDNLRNITPAVIRRHPAHVATLRMCTAPPIARDRLAGLTGVAPGFVQSLENGYFPPRATYTKINTNLDRICGVVTELLDVGLFEWLSGTGAPDPVKREIAAVVVGDRRTQALSNAVVRNAQEARQLVVVGQWLSAHGYRELPAVVAQRLTAMRPGTYAFRQNVPVLDDDGNTINMPIDAVVQPLTPDPSGLPLLIEAKSAGDFANPNKRRKEEATKIRQLRKTYGTDIRLVLFLCGYFDTNYLAYEAAEGLDWIWEHRPDDLSLAGL